MSKTIIHQRFEMDKFTPKLIADFHGMIRKALPEKYILITSPTEIIKVDGETPVLMIDAKEYTANELMEILKAVEK